jgi:hypothetical protein
VSLRQTLAIGKCFANSNNKNFAGQHLSILAKQVHAGLRNDRYSLGRHVKLRKAGATLNLNLWEDQMTTYNTSITIENSNQVVLSGLPFEKGQRVRVMILTEEEARSAIGQNFRELFRETQSLPGVSEITEEEIAVEISAYRQER